MKITTDPMQYCRQIPKGMRAVLLYGPNRSLVLEAIQGLSAAFFAGKEKNDFSVVTVTPEQLKQNPTMLADEFSSFGFFAAEKLIHIRNADDPILKFVQEALELPGAGHFVILEGEELGPKSTLRAWAEKANDVASVPCYMLEGAALSRFVQGQFTAQNVRISGDAVTLIIQRLGNDLSALKNLIPQLVDYVGENNIVQLEHVEAMLVDQAEQELDNAVQAVADMQMPQMDRALHTLDASGISMVAVLRSLQNYFYRLRNAHVAMKNGEDIEAYMKRQRIFFKLQPAFKRHLRNWNLQRVDGALNEFVALEAACKKTGTPELNLVQFRLMKLCLSKAA